MITTTKVYNIRYLHVAKSTVVVAKNITKQ